MHGIDRDEDALISYSCSHALLSDVSCTCSNLKCCYYAKQVRRVLLMKGAVELKASRDMNDCWQFFSLQIFLRKQNDTATL